MSRKRKLFRVVTQEIESYTGYVYAKDLEDVERIVYETDYQPKSNQDFEQRIFSIIEINKAEISPSIEIND
ncbi:MAG TPA: hypothetical protein PLP88_03035 [Bacteroidales bacterium]|nr:hypothetical protein [Bacteroidales bacterium]